MTEAIRSGVRISFQGNVVCANRFRTRNENETFARLILILILGYDPWRDAEAREVSSFDTYGGKIEYYREY